MTDGNEHVCGLFARDVLDRTRAANDGNCGAAVLLCTHSRFRSVGAIILIPSKAHQGPQGRSTCRVRGKVPTNALGCWCKTSFVGVGAQSERIAPLPHFPPVTSQLPPFLTSSHSTTSTSTSTPKCQDFPSRSGHIRPGSRDCRCRTTSGFRIYPPIVRLGRTRLPDSKHTTATDPISPLTGHGSSQEGGG